VQDPDKIAAHLEDAAHVPGGHAAALYLPASEADVAAVLRSSRAVLPIGAQSSLTGGATPMGETLVATSRLDQVLAIESDQVRVQAGVPLADLDPALAQVGLYYPPAPTFAGAFVGGVVATNAAGAATFKYGTTRDWVRSLTVVLSSGDVLDIERGATRAHPDGYFELHLERGTVRVPVPSYHMPTVPKLSAGYFAAPQMDLIDLFIGSEGTLGVVTEVTLAVIPRPAFSLAFVSFADRRRALSMVRRLHDAATATRRDRDPRGIDVSAIEHVDKRCLELLREERADRAHGVTIRDDAVIAALITLELPAGTSAAAVYEEIGRADDPDAPDTPLVRFCRLLTEHDETGDAVIAAPGDVDTASRLLALREAVPALVNHRVARAQRTADPRIEKTAADMVVPFGQIEPALDMYADVFGRRGLDVAIWGHISDGNVHPNVIPRSFADVVAGREAILEIGRRVIEMGGAPMAEHGVGRNPTKQRLLGVLYGESGLNDMRRVKSSLDPEWKLSPGVIFPMS
jgi:D-lactate dehydrogenase (cytochrome)